MGSGPDGTDDEAEEAAGDEEDGGVKEAGGAGDVLDNVLRLSNEGRGVQSLSLMVGGCC